MELYEKSLRTIELPAGLDMLAAKAVSDAAKENARALRPSAEPGEVRDRLAETTAAKKMMETKGSPSFSGLKDVRPSLARADMGGVLNTRELLDIARVLFCARACASYASGREEQPGALRHLFSVLVSNRYLEDKINTSITTEEEIADAASAELADLRRKMRAASSRVRETLQKIISSPSYAKSLQEPIISQRAGRYVVPVRADRRADIPGLVHDVSGSGATLWVEPMDAVKANNELRELKAKETEEINRILAELSADCAAARDTVTMDVTVLTKLDLVFAKAELSYDMNGGEPEITESRLILRRARHPLLPKESAVPVDVSLGDECDTMVITGPNTGGKTVTLKTLGLMCAMAGCGLHLPAADGTAVPVLRAILADIGDEQSIEQSLSTFSGHMVTIVDILRACEPGTLVLLDEVGAGTDPTEGAALAIAIIEYARQAGALTVATTHYAELKVYATNTAGVRNASCEFDVETLRPTYRLLVGIPGKSNAFAISARLGLPECVIDDARKRLSAESTDFEKTIERLEQQRLAMEKLADEEARAKRAAEQDARRAEELRRELEVRLEKAEQKARREAEQILNEARRAADEAFREIDRQRSAALEENDHREINNARAELRRRLNETEQKVRAREPQPQISKKQSSRAIRAGDTVELLSSGTRAEVIEVKPNGELLLQAGILKISVKQQDVNLLENIRVSTPKNISSAAGTALRESISSEIDLRGMMADEAELAVERYIDSAAMSKLKTVTIIHGKGTGALRSAVQRCLKSNRLIKSYRLGRYGEGETGVTVVELK